jgi:hypothetical protein
VPFQRWIRFVTGGVLFATFLGVLGIMATILSGSTR